MSDAVTFQLIDDTAVVVDRSLYRRVDMRANEDGVPPTAAELGLESKPMKRTMTSPMTTTRTTSFCRVRSLMRTQ